MTNKKYKVPNVVGSSLWAYNMILGPIMTRFLDDLVIYEDQPDGIGEDNCRKIRTTLGKWCNASTEISDRIEEINLSFIFINLQKIENLYIKWNEVEGDDIDSINERRLLLEEIRNIRQNLASKKAKIRDRLYKKLDLNSVKKVYSLLDEMKESLSEELPTFTDKMNDLAKKMPSFNKASLVRSEAEA